MLHSRYGTVRQRFWKKVTGDVNDLEKCWIWVGAKTNSGRGLFVANGKHHQAHRFSWEMEFEKEISRGDFTKFDCGNILCVNPHHLIVKLEIDRFFDFFMVGDIEECWEWSGSLRQGYGRFSVRGKGYPAHRYSYEYYNDVKLSKELFALHNCNNKACVNPHHLRSGTHSENVKDVMDYKRANPSDDDTFGPAGLTVRDVREIKSLLSEGVMLKKKIAEKFGVSPCTITDIRVGRTWAWLK